jgi:adenosylmethionine-8-amino-7-oxononanoate aminotransferase
MYFTFTGNDAACAAGAKVLEILRREHLVERAASTGAVLGQRLHAEFGEHPAVVDIRGRGMFYGLELRCSRDAVVQAAMDRDMWVYPAGSGPVADAVMVAPPFIITDAEIDLLISTLRASLDAVYPG